MAVPFSYPTGNITGIYGLAEHVNNITNGSFGIVLLLLIFILSFIVSRATNLSRGLGFSVFITFILSILLRFMGLISDAIMYIVVVFLVASVVWMWKSKSEDLYA